MWRFSAFPKNEENGRESWAKKMVFVVLGKFFTYLKGKLANSPNTSFFGGLGFNSS